MFCSFDDVFFFKCCNLVPVLNPTTVQCNSAQSNLLLYFMTKKDSLSYTHVAFKALVSAAAHSLEKLT